MQSRQPFEVELDLFPGQIFQGKVDAILLGKRRGERYHPHV